MGSSSQGIQSTKVAKISSTETNAGAEEESKIPRGRSDQPNDDYWPNAVRCGAELPHDSTFKPTMSAIKYRQISY